MKAGLKNYNQSPRKVRLVANLIKGKRANDALVQLEFLPKRAADPISKLLKSAIANARTAGIAEELLVVDNVTVDAGIVLKRMMPRAFGRGSGIKKRRSHVVLTLKSQEPKKKVKKETSKKK